MEKSIGFELDSYMREVFQMEEVDVKSYSPLTLAYIGDCIYDLVIKSLVINEGNKQVNKLHQETSKLVQASAQSLMMRTMQAVCRCCSLESMWRHCIYRTQKTKAVDDRRWKKPTVTFSGCLPTENWKQKR